MNKRQSGLALGLLVLSLAAQASVAAPVYWTPSSGNTGALAYSDGQSDKGLFGNPIVTGSTFTFFPADFEADAPKANGTTGQSTSDRLSFQAAAVGNGTLSNITVHEVGDYAILGAAGLVQATGALFVTDLTGARPVALTGNGLTPTVTYTSNGVSSSSLPAGTGSGLFAVDYTFVLPSGVRSVQVVLNNFLQAVAPTGSAAEIQKKGVTITINDPAVPEPTVAGLFAAAGLLAARRRRTPTA